MKAFIASTPRTAKPVMLPGQLSPAHLPGPGQRLCRRPVLPVNVACTGRLDQARQLAARNPNTRLVIDHLGLSQPHEPPASARPFADLPKLLALAAHDNVAVKVSGAGALSHEPFPYKDIWDPLGQVFDAFGFDRCVWGTDWDPSGRHIDLQAGSRSLSHHRPAFRGRRAKLMRETLSRIYNWPKAQA